MSLPLYYIAPRLWAWEVFTEPDSGVYKTTVKTRALTTNGPNYYTYENLGDAITDASEFLEGVKEQHTLLLETNGYELQS